MTIGTGIVMSVGIICATFLFTFALALFKKKE